MFIMDYSNPRTCFTGKIHTTILDEAVLKEIMEIYDRLSDLYSYPKDFKKNLQDALQLREDPAKYTARVEAYYAS